MNTIVNGKILLPDGMAEDHALLYTNRIVGIVPTDYVPADAVCIDAMGGYVMPGLIDLHIHGYGGCDVCDDNPETLRQMEGALLKQGVTGWLATTMTVEENTLRRALSACRTVMSEPGSTLLGVHAEGPYINPEKAGAQDPTNVVSPSPAFIKEYGDVIKVLTLAPETDEDCAAIRELTQDTDIVLSMGHTAADYDTAMAGIAAGITHVTHLFNAMSPLHHRAPGAVGAALTADVSCELIADNHHVHPALYDLVWRQKGRRLCLVTDCLAAADTADGTGMLGGKPIEVRDGLCCLSDGTIAGSTLRLIEAIGNLHRHSSVPLWECVNCASLNPAAVMGLSHRKGSLEAGKDADILITDAALQVQTVVVGSQVRYTR